MHMIAQSERDRIEYSDYPEDISTGGMGPCLGILIYSHETRVTYGLYYDAEGTEAPVMRAGRLPPALACLVSIWQKTAEAENGN
jgi:hypothetical protein